MPIKIHHGPPGSYKTAGAMADDFLREARAGRVIVTNVRGVSRERTLEDFPDLPDSFDVIHVDDKTSEGREKWSKWFHWMPHGAFIFVDEVQDIWPKSWKTADIDALDYPGGVDMATKDDRPKDWDQALDKHRHYNWDMTLTTPAYSKVRGDIKDIADMAYKHKNLALIGWSGRYIEGAHAADDTGKNASDFISVEKKKVPSYVFKLYDSTQTGQVSDTKSGINLLKSPKVLLLLGIIAIAGILVGSRPVPSVIASVAGAAPQAAGSGHSSSVAVPSSGRPLDGASSSTFKAGKTGSLTPFDGDGVFIVMSVKVGTVWKYVISYQGYDFTNRDILEMGYSITTAGACGVTLRKDNFERFITCGVDERHEKMQAAALVVASPSPVSAHPAPIPAQMPSDLSAASPKPSQS